MWNDELREEIRAELESYFDDNIEEAVDLAEQMEFDWAIVYNGLNDLYDDYFCGDLQELIWAFCRSGADADNYADYCVIDDLIVCDADDRVNYAEDHIESIVGRLMQIYEDGKLLAYQIRPSKNVTDILETTQETVSLEDLKQACSYSVFDIIGDVGRFNDGIISYDELLDTCELVAAEQKVERYLIDTDFCGVPESAYERILAENKCNEQCKLPSVIAYTYVMDNEFGQSVSLNKFIEIYMNKYKEV